MEELIQKYCVDLEGKCHFYLTVLDILADDEVCKYERCLWRLEPDKEPIVKQDEEPFCKKCIQVMLINESESFAVCISCGIVKPILIFRQNYKDKTYERTGYLYKRITHFRKHWRDLQKRIGYLRIDQYNDRAELMFKTIEPLFRKYKPETRRNFFNYQYVLIKFFELFKEPKIRKFLTYLKSREKLEAHDDIWIQICREKGWNFIPSRRRIEHKRKYKKRIRRKNDRISAKNYNRKKN